MPQRPRPKGLVGRQLSYHAHSPPRSCIVSSSKRRYCWGPSMTRRRTLTLVSLVTGIAVIGGSPGHAQRPAAPTLVNWPLHNLDLAGGRYSPLDQINTANVKSLVPRWLFQHGVIDGVSNQTTPVMVDGITYMTDARGSVYAVDAADGHLLWSYDVSKLIGGDAKSGYVFRNRGVCYADGVVYVGAGSFLF